MLKHMLKQIENYKAPKNETMAEFLKRKAGIESPKNLNDELETFQEVKAENDFDRMINDKIRNNQLTKDGWVILDNGFYKKLD